MSSKESKSRDKVALSYHDCLLRNGDVDLLRGCHWLNDAVIGFYFEYLGHKNERSRENKRDILFVSPELTQLLKFTESSDYPVFLGPLNPSGYDYILFPLNDCESRDSAGGSHWSLLVFSRKENTSFHLDSCRGTNKRMALQFAQKAMNFLCDKRVESIVKEADCAQQENGYDCGLFAICLADIISKHVAENPHIGECKFDGVKSLVRTKRAELLRLIDELKNSLEQ